MPPRSTDLDSTPAEFQLIAELAAIFGAPPKPTLGIGDDAALLRPNPGMDLVWTTDSALENVHFRWSWISPRDLGYRAFAATVSDLYAMGASPVGVLLTLHVPPELPRTSILDFARGLAEGATKAGTWILGGNITRSREFSADLTGLGEVPTGMALLRSGAKPGDDLYVTGEPGGAALAVELLQRGMSDRPEALQIVSRWRRPDLRDRESRILREYASACIDISDGLLQDAGHLGRSSGVGIQIQLADLPASEDLRAGASLLDIPVEKLRCHPSDDYELLFAAPETYRSPLEIRLGGAIKRVGKTTAQTGKVQFLAPNGTEVPYIRSGWDHLSTN